MASGGRNRRDGIPAECRLANSMPPRHRLLRPAAETAAQQTARFPQNPPEQWQKSHFGPPRVWVEVNARSGPPPRASGSGAGGRFPLPNAAGDPGCTVPSPFLKPALPLGRALRTRPESPRGFLGCLPHTLGFVTSLAAPRSSLAQVAGLAPARSREG